MLWRPVLDPTSVDWILNNPSPDPTQHYLGVELFRRSPVHLPYIGANYNAVHPFRTSVLFTDSLPLAALLFAAGRGSARAVPVFRLVGSGLLYAAGAAWRRRS